MVEWGRGGGDGRGRAETWPEDAAARRRRALAWPDGLANFGHAAVERFHNWAVADAGPGRLLPWLPVAFGLGVAIYFTAEREPSFWAAGGLASLCAVATVVARRRPIGFPLALALTALAAGFAVATLKTVQVAHPILARPAGNVAIAGFVEVREER
jgi:competence protein ComEC